MSTNAYRSEQHIYYDEVVPTKYYGYYLSTSGSGDSLEWFKTAESRLRFEACVAKCILEEEQPPSGWAIRVTAAYLLLTEIGSEEFLDDFLSRQEILIADVRWPELLEGLENRTTYGLSLSDEELIDKLLSEFVDEEVEQVLMLKRLDATVERHIAEGYLIGESRAAYGPEQQRFLRYLLEVVSDRPCSTRAHIVREPVFKWAFKTVSTLFSPTGWTAVDGILGELEAIRQRVSVSLGEEIPSAS